MQINYSLPMRLFAAILCLALTACGVGTAPSIAPPTQTTPSQPAAPPPPPPAPKVTVFIGDSITAIWGSTAAFQAHTNWINKGISGQGSQAIAMRFQTDVVDLHPDTVHIIMGTNDVYPGWKLCDPTVPGEATPTTPPGPESLGYISDTCSNMIYMVETAKRNNIRVVIGTIPPWALDADPVCWLTVADESPERYDRINQLNAWIKDFAAKEGVTVVDYHTALSNSIGLHYAAGLTTDCVHPNPAGYVVMQPLVESAVGN